MSRFLPVWPLCIFSLLSLALLGCDETLVQTDLHLNGDGPMIALDVVRSNESALPEAVDRARLRVTGGATPEVIDIALPAPGEARSISVPVPAGSYAVALVVYSDTYDEAYAFADTAGVSVEANQATEVNLDLASVTAGPDYLLGQELQVTPDADSLSLSAFFSTPDLHPSLPNATLYYDPSPFGVPEDAGYTATMNPELDSYYVANLSQLGEPAFTDSVYFRVETPLSSVWGDSLRAIAPSVAAGEAPYSSELGGGIVVTFLRWLH